MIDVDHEISTTRRQLGRRALEAGEARVMTISRVYDTTLEDLWEACTSPQRIPRWFLPVSGELRLGGRFQLEGNAGGTVERCDPPRSFAATWEYGGETSWIEVRVEEAGAGQARFVLEHVAHVEDERWAEFGPAAVGIGWDLALIGLSAYLEPDADPVEAAAWAASDEGRRFMARSADAWAEAGVAAGEDRAAAAAAAERTLAAYTA